MSTINDYEVINFIKMSHQLGLHRDSYNYLTSSCRSKSLSKIKHFYRSIEPVEEEPEETVAEIQIAKTQHKKNKSVFYDVNKTYVANHMKRASQQNLTDNQKRIRRQILRNGMYDELIDNQAQQDQQKL